MYYIFIYYIYIYIIAWIEYHHRYNKDVIIDLIVI